MQPPTCHGIRVRTPADAHVIFHAVANNKLRMVSRRLDTDERRAISSGCVYVWEERGPNTEATGLGIERWTDSIQWGPSRVRDEFLYYQEKSPSQVDVDMTSDSDTTTHLIRPGTHRPSLTKQTYSVFVATPRGERKWHLIAYYTDHTLRDLYTVDDHPDYPILGALRVPRGMYRSARSSKTRRPTHSMPTPRLETPRPFDPPSSRPIPPGRHGETLAPLAYLKALPPHPRHVVDQMAINSLPFDMGRFSASQSPDSGISRPHGY